MTEFCREVGKTCFLPLYWFRGMLEGRLKSFAGRVLGCKGHTETFHLLVGHGKRIKPSDCSMDTEYVWIPSVDASTILEYKRYALCFNRGGAFSQNPFSQNPVWQNLFSGFTENRERPTRIWLPRCQLLHKSACRRFRKRNQCHYTLKWALKRK